MPIFSFAAKPPGNPKASLSPGCSPSVSCPDQKTALRDVMAILSPVLHGYFFVAQDQNERNGTSQPIPKPKEIEQKFKLVLEGISVLKESGRPQKELMLHLSCQFEAFHTNFPFLEKLKPEVKLQVRNIFEAFAGLPLSAYSTPQIVAQSSAPTFDDVVTVFGNVIGGILLKTRTPLSKTDEINVRAKIVAYIYQVKVSSDAEFESNSRQARNIACNDFLRTIFPALAENEQIKGSVTEAFKKLADYILDLKIKNVQEEQISRLIEPILISSKEFFRREQGLLARDAQQRDAEPLPPSPTASSSSTGSSRGRARSFASTPSPTPMIPADFFSTSPSSEVDEPVMTPEQMELRQQEAFADEVMAVDLIHMTTEAWNALKAKMIAFAKKIHDGVQPVSSDAVFTFAKALAKRKFEGVDQAYLYFINAIFADKITDPIVILNFAMAFSVDNTTGQIIRKPGLIKLFQEALRHVLETREDAFCNSSNQRLFEQALAGSQKLLLDEVSKQNQIRHMILAKSLAEKNILDSEGPYLEFIEDIECGKVTNYTDILKFSEAFSEQNEYLNRPVIRNPEILNKFISVIGCFIEDKKALVGEQRLWGHTLVQFEAALAKARQTLDFVERKTACFQAEQVARENLGLNTNSIEAIDWKRIELRAHTQRPQQQIQTAYAVQMGFETDTSVIQQLAQELGSGMVEGRLLDERSYAHFVDAIECGQVKNWDSILVFAKAFFDKKEIFQNPDLTLKFMSWLIGQANVLDQEQVSKIPCGPDALRIKAISTLRDSIVEWVEDCGTTVHECTTQQRVADFLADRVHFSVPQAYEAFLKGIESGKIYDQTAILKFAESFCDRPARITNPMALNANFLKRVIEVIERYFGLEQYLEQRNESKASLISGLVNQRRNSQEGQNLSEDQRKALEVVDKLTAQRVTAEAYQGSVDAQMTRRSEAIQAHLKSIKDNRRNSRLTRELESNWDAACAQYVTRTSERAKTFFFTEEDRDPLGRVIADCSQFIATLATPEPKKPWWKRLKNWFFRGK